jgi:chemotaxis protein MotB
MKPRSLKSRRTTDHVQHDRWLVSYADFITLLFAFFVVLYASSRADERKQTQIAHSIQSAFQALGIFPSTPPVKDHLVTSTDSRTPVPPVNVVLGDDLAPSPSVQQDLERLQAHLATVLSAQVSQHIVALKLGRDGLVISLRESGFYDSGSALPHRQSKAALDQIAATISATPYDIRIEGHTDNVPIHTAQFASNWELSTARASELAKIFIVDYHFAPERLSAAGFAEYHPVAPNDTPEGRSQNRRIDIIVLPRISVVPIQNPQH